MANGHCARAACVSFCFNFAHVMFQMFHLFQCFNFWRTTSVTERGSWGTFFSTKGGKKEKKGGKEEKEGGGKKGGEKGGERGGERKRGKFKELYQCFNRNCNCRQPCWGCFGLFGPHQCSEAIPSPPISYYQLPI